MIIVQNVFIDTGCAKSCITKLTFQGSATVFTANQKQVMTVRSYGNCSNFCPQYSVLSTDGNKKPNITENRVHWHLAFSLVASSVIFTASVFRRQKFLKE
jgi:hypothetical protein